MPYMPKRTCIYPGCPNSSAHQYCDYHRKLMNKLRSEYHNRKLYGRKWEHIRDRYVAKHPLCELCEAEGRLTPAAEVHHILPLADGGDNSDANLQALCKPCHSRITLQANKDKGLC